jgi:hypothetical protein
VGSDVCVGVYNDEMILRFENVFYCIFIDRAHASWCLQTERYTLMHKIEERNI